MLFDLDNTLYPPRAGLMAELDRRIAGYFARRLNMRVPQAERLQVEYCWQYGSCTNGVLKRIPLNLERFLSEVHDIDARRYLRPDPALETLLAQTPLHKWVFTNAPLEYARRVLEALAVAQHFRGVFDIRFADFVGKPDPQAYHRVIGALGTAGEQCVMVEDSARNLRPAKALGMNTVLVSPNGVAPGWVDVVLPDLSGLPVVLAHLRAKEHGGTGRSA